MSNMMSQPNVSVASALSNRTITFVDDIDSVFNCVICMQVADDPVRCNGMCGGVYCNGCMTQALAHRMACPACNKSNITAMRDVVLRNQIMKHQVYCPNKSAAITSYTYVQATKRTDELCPWIGRYDGLGTHLSVCKLELVRCPNSGCIEKMERRELKAHELACRHRKILCNHCNVMFNTLTIQNHLTVCPMMDVVCEVAVCGARMKRKDYEKHNDQSAQKHVRLLSAELLKQSTRARLQYAELLESYEEQQNLSDELAEAKQQASLLSADLLKQSAEVQRLMKHIQVTWRVEDVADKLRYAAIYKGHYESQGFDICSYGKHKLFLIARVHGNQLGLHLCKDILRSENKCRLKVGGTSITVTKAGLPDAKKIFGLDTFLEQPGCLAYGIFLLADMTPYIDNNGINVTVDIKLSHDEPITKIVL